MCPNHEQNKKCKIDGCGRPGVRRGLCNLCGTLCWRNLCGKHKKRLPMIPKGVRNEFRKIKECYYCGAIISWKKETPSGFSKGTIDHIIPKKSGGTNERNNLIASCEKCNNKKGDLSFSDFIT